MDADFRHAAKPLVLVSDISGTLAGHEFPGGWNDPLFDLLIEARVAGHTAIIATSTVDPVILEIMGETVHARLLDRSRPENLFDLEGTLQPCASKKTLTAYLQARGISFVDYVFEDDKVDYLPPERVGQKINPLVFIKSDPPSQSVVTDLRGQLQTLDLNH